MKTLSGGQAAIASLQAERVGHVFGLIGSATMEMFDALYDAEDIAFIGVHDERTGTHMADGYARASGRPGVIPRRAERSRRDQSRHRPGPGSRRLLARRLHRRGPVVGPCLPRRLSGGRPGRPVPPRHQEDLDGDVDRPGAGDVPRSLPGRHGAPARAGAAQPAARRALGARPSFRNSRRPRLTAPRPFPRARPRPSRRPPNGSAAPPARSSSPAVASRTPAATRRRSLWPKR